MTDRNNIELTERLKAKYAPEGSDLRIAQLRMLELLKFLDKICKDNNLKYWLDSGTLLGARRHGGFIPWDDDTDVCMPTKDALKLQKIMGSKIFDSHIVLHGKHSDKNYVNSSWLTLRDTKMEYVQDRAIHNELKYRGVQVDIFFVDKGVIMNSKRIANLLKRKLVFNPLMNKKSGKISKRVARFFDNLIEQYVIRPLRSIHSRSQFYNTDVGVAYKFHIHESTIFPLKRISFEGVEFNCPNDTDEYLKIIYGEWEKVPDENSIKTHNAQFKFIE